MKIIRYDHIVLTVENIERSVRFYGDVLGMEIQTFGEGRKAARFGQQKINFQEIGKEIDPKADNPTSGSGDICLITESTPDEVIRHLTGYGVSIELGPVPRTGAVGSVISVYIRDPDGNLVEISSYPGFD